ncbi:nitroreductase family protein [Saccharopolyspora tripterygii]
MGVAQVIRTDVLAQEAEWSAAETVELDASVWRAPSALDSRPWSLTLRQRTAVLREDPAARMPHDPQGRDQRMSCGAAVMNLVLTVRNLGFSARVEVGAAGGLVSAAVHAGEPDAPSPREAAWARAIAERHSHRTLFARKRVPELLREKIWDAAAGHRCGGRWIKTEGEVREVSRMLGRAGAVHADDERDRELAEWVTSEGGQLGHESSELGGLDAGDLTAPSAHLPDERALADLLRDESVLLVGSRGDRAEDHVRVGQAIERAWLEATSAGLVVSMMTQPLHPLETRTGLAERLGTSLIPQAIMRFGYPA